MMSRTLAALIVVFTAPASADPSLACAPVRLDAALAALDTAGWTRATDPATLTDAQVEALAWTLLTPYLTDSGGEEMATLLDLQRAAVPGLMRKVDTETTRARVLLAGDEVLTITETRTLPDRVERVCRVAGALSVPEGTTLLDTSDLSGAPATLAEVTILVDPAR